MRGHEIQISVKIRKKKGQIVTKKLLQDAIERQIETGKKDPNIVITAINWSVNKRAPHVYTDPKSIDEIVDKLRYIPEIRPRVFHKVR